MSIIISDTININQLISNCISNERGEIILECRKIDDIFDTCPTQTDTTTSWALPALNTSTRGCR
jgi:hypothetical protein